MTALNMKQADAIRSGPQVIYNLTQLLIKFPCGLGGCLILTTIGKQFNLKGLALIGSISYELYLVHGYVLQWVSISMIGGLLFIAGSVFGAMLLHRGAQMIKKPCRRLLLMD